MTAGRLVGADGTDPAFYHPAGALGGAPRGGRPARLWAPSEPSWPSRRRRRGVMRCRSRSGPGPP
jgi:hypothetical protein